VRAIRQVVEVLRVLARARRNRLDLLRALARRPQLLLGTGVYELAIVLSARVDARLKILAELKAAAMVSCEFCLDIGSEIARGSGLSDAHLRDLPRFRASDRFDDDERLVLELAEAMTMTPAVVPDDLRERLERRFTPAQRTELAAVVACENQRARLNQALGVRPSGFSDGRLCARPEIDVAAGRATAPA
jgi:alkylhydroperoxidase family enzyme